MEPRSAPQDVITLAEERAAARDRRDWSTADALKARIEAAGWQVIDAGTDFDLLPSTPPDVVEDGHTWYGAVGSVPSRLDEPASMAATVVVVAEPGTRTAGATLRALAEHRPPDTQVLVVTSRGLADPGPADEIVGTARPLTAGEAMQAAARRALGAIIVVLDADRIPTSDVVGPLRAALADPSVAIAGIEGLRSADLRRYQPADGDEATTLRSGCYGFRRDDLIVQGPVDGRLYLRDSVAAWLGLLLRDEGPESPSRRALVLDLPVRPADDDPELPDDHARRARRDSYRIADRFRDRPWLCAGPSPRERLVGDGAEEHDPDDRSHEERDTTPA